MLTPEYTLDYKLQDRTTAVVDIAISGPVVEFL